jgi:hypothetical protein
MSTANKLYAPIANKPELEFVLAPKTLNNYERMKRIVVQSACISDQDKASVCKEMGWSADDCSNELTTLEHFREMAKVLFVGYEKHASPDDNLDMRVIRAAAEDFFF